ncbi:MAG: glycoside hydrolase family 9 protein [Bacteroidota bacterium]
MKKTKYILLVLITCFSSLITIAQTNSSQHKIRLNQIGFYINAEKKAIILSADTGKFYLQNSKGEKVFTGRLAFETQPTFSGMHTSVADFTKYNVPGTYVVFVPSSGHSYPFNIGASIHRSLADATIKAFYYQRASTPLDEKFAGKWHRAAGHADDKVIIHASAADQKRPEGTIISSPQGWYDAGDYNKYIVNSGISTSTVLSLYEDFSGYMNAVKLNIPESSNQVPDILDEALWNIRWMLTMQDPNDGGVYHKLTNAKFDAMIMPGKAATTRYVVQKGTAAALDFAAVTAQAARIFKKFKHQLPGFADSCLKASLSAYKWALKNPNIAYEQVVMNKKYKPEITTGAYGDKYFADEFIWAASELYSTTGKAGYLKTVLATDDPKISLPTWSNVKLLGYYSLIDKQPRMRQILEIEARVLNFASELTRDADKNAYQTAMGKSADNFNWGSNSNAANQGILFIKAYRLTHDKRYLNNALANLDYILGRNGSGYSYVTGYGSKSTIHPHHRPSIADGIVDPVPGLLAGGPNPGMQDGIKVPSTAPDEAYIDDDRAYAANEVAINWNAPIAYLANAIEALQKDLEKP